MYYLIKLIILLLYTIDYDLPGVGIMKNSFEKIGLASFIEYSISKLYKR